MKRFFAALLAASFLSLPAVNALCAEEEPPALSAKAALVMEAANGEVLYELAADEPMLIASTTKIMTALVVLERCTLDREVTVDPAWTGVEGSSMYLKPGQKLTVEDLLYGLMLASGNDAAVALACVTAGSVEAFADLMNDKAEELGCTNTHFSNANGLDAPDHYASARDLALITRAAIQYDDFRRIVSTRRWTVGENTYVNHNRLLDECEGVFGGKTGYTMAAGRTLVTCCERKGLALICVTLSDPDDWDDHKALYDWAYGLYDRDAVLAGMTWSVPVIGGVTDSAKVVSADGLPVLHRAGDEITVEYKLPAFVYAAIAAGQNAGEAVAYIDGREAGRSELVYVQDVPQAPAAEPTFWSRVRDFFDKVEESGVFYQ